MRFILAQVDAGDAHLLETQVLAPALDGPF